MCRSFWASLFISLIFFHFPAFGGCLLPLSEDEEIASAAAICRGSVISCKSFLTKDGQIYTGVEVQVDEVLKGQLPSIIEIVYRGGQLADGRTAVDSLSPEMRVGEENLLFLNRTSQGALFFQRGKAGVKRLEQKAQKKEKGAGRPFRQIERHEALLKKLRGQKKLVISEVSEKNFSTQSSADLLEPKQESTGITENTTFPREDEFPPLTISGDGIPGRWLAPDRGESIPVLVDIATLPTGITQEQGIKAVQDALAAWATACSVRFDFDPSTDLTNFGQAAYDIATTDRVLRIQLHDLFNSIEDNNASSAASTLGRAQFRTSFPSSLGGVGGDGGKVNEQEFHEIVNAGIVINHTQSALSEYNVFYSTLLHEIGHTMGINHSSEDFLETFEVLSKAVMYAFNNAGPGELQQLQGWDIGVVNRVHPVGNTPPFSANIIWSVITKNASGSSHKNTLQLPSFDLQSAPAELTASAVEQTSNGGTFSLQASTLTYTATLFFNQSVTSLESSFFDRFRFRLSDGTHLSPIYAVRIVAGLFDSFPSEADGLPDKWMLQYFGNADPSVGSRRGASDDFDGDGFTNLQEFYLWTDPTNPSSALKLTAFDRTTEPGSIHFEWQASPFINYQLQMSTDLITWAPAMYTISVESDSIGSATLRATNLGNHTFFRVKLLP